MHAKVEGYPAAVQSLDLISDDDPAVRAYERAFAEWVDEMGQGEFPYSEGVSPYGVYIPTRFRDNKYGISALCRRHFVPRRPNEWRIGAENLAVGDRTDPVSYHLSRRTFSLRTPRDFHMVNKHVDAGFDIVGVVDYNRHSYQLITAIDRIISSWLDYHIMHGAEDNHPQGILSNASVVTKGQSRSFAIQKLNEGAHIETSALFIPESDSILKWNEAPLSDYPAWDGSQIIQSDVYGGTDEKVLRGFFDDYLLVQDVGVALRCHSDPDSNSDFVHWIATFFLDGIILRQDSFMVIDDE